MRPAWATKKAGGQPELQQNSVSKRQDGWTERGKQEGERKKKHLKGEKGYFNHRTWGDVTSGLTTETCGRKIFRK